MKTRNYFVWSIGKRRIDDVKIKKFSILTDAKDFVDKLAKELAEKEENRDDLLVIIKGSKGSKFIYEKYV